MHVDCAKNTFNIPDGDGVEHVEDWELAFDAAFVANVPIPTRFGFSVLEKGQINAGTWIFVDCEGGRRERAQVKRMDGSMITLTNPLKNWPKVGGLVHRILGRARHHINVKDMERINKMIKNGKLKNHEPFSV